MCVQYCSVIQELPSRVLAVFSVIALLTFKILTVSLRTTRFIVQKFYTVLALLRVFCTDLRTGSDVALYIIK